MREQPTAEVEPEAELFRADPRWRFNPDIRKVPCLHHDPDWWDSDNRNSLAAIKLCALQCPLRRDCYAEGMRNDDVGVIRGGIKMTTNKAKLAYCTRCGMMAVRQSKTRVGSICSVCLNTRDCKGCSKKFYAEVRANQQAPEYCTRSCKVGQVVRRMKEMRARQQRLEEARQARLAPLIARLKKQRTGVQNATSKNTR